MSQPQENLSKTLLILIQLGPHTTNPYPIKTLQPKLSKRYKKSQKEGWTTPRISPISLGRPAHSSPFFYHFFLHLSSTILTHPRLSKATTTWVSTPSRRRRCYRHSTIGSSLKSSSLAWISDRETRAGWIAIQDRESLSSV